VVDNAQEMQSTEGGFLPLVIVVVALLGSTPAY